MKEKEKEKHPLLIQEEKLTKLQSEICGHYNSTNAAWREVTQEIEMLRHKIVLDAIKAAINLNYTHLEEVKSMFTTLNMSNETLQEQT